MQQRLSRTSDPLLGKMWKTKSSRFNAHARLKAKHWLSTASTSILSFYLIIASLVPLVYESSLPIGASKFLSVISVVISIFLIIITLLESAKNYHADSDKMHKCALEISELYNRFQAMQPVEAEASRRDLNDSYSIILKNHEMNHNDIDFIRFQIMYKKDLSISNSQYVVLVLRYLTLWIGEYGLYIAMIALPPLLMFFFRSQIGL